MALDALNDCQRAAACAPIDTHIRIVASPGSGKSRTLAARVSFLLERGVPAAEIKVMTFSRNATHDIASRLPAEIEVRTIHALALRYQSMVQRGPEQRSLFGGDEVPDEYVHLMDPSTGPAEGPHLTPDENIYNLKRRLESPDGVAAIRALGEIGHLLVDEAQDLDDMQWAVIRLLARHMRASVFMVGDPCQNIYGFRRSSSRFLLRDMDDLPHFGVLSFALSVNYRSTRQIVAACNAMTPPQQTVARNGKMRIGEAARGAMTSGRGGGPCPRLACFAGKSSELEYVVLKIVELLAAGASAWDVAVVSRSQRDCYAACHKLSERGVAATVITGDAEQPPSVRAHPPRVAICTIHGSKGLEWNHVFVVGCSDSLNQSIMTAEEEIQEANLFYVAATRAKEQLLITSPSKNYTRFLAAARRERAIDVVPEDPVHGTVAPLDVRMVGGSPYTRSVRSVTHFVRHAPGEVYARLKDDGIIPSRFPGASTIRVHAAHQYPSIRGTDVAALYAVFVERVVHRQMDAVCRARLVDAGADAAAVEAMRSSDGHANHCFLYVADIGSRLTQKELGALARGCAQEFDLPEGMVRLATVDEALPAYEIARRALYRQGSPEEGFFLARVNALRKSYRAFCREGTSLDPHSERGSRILADVAVCAHIAHPPAKTHMLYSKIVVDSEEMREFNKGLFAQTREVLGTLVSEFASPPSTWPIDEDVPAVASNELYVRRLGMGFDIDLSSPSLHGVADLLVGTCIVEVKCSTDAHGSAVCMQWILQLLCYAALARRRGVRVDSIAVYNPLRGTLWRASVSAWRGDVDLLDAIADILASNLGNVANAG